MDCITVASDPVGSDDLMKRHSSICSTLSSASVIRGAAEESEFLSLVGNCVWGVLEAVPQRLWMHDPNRACNSSQSTNNRSLLTLVGADKRRRPIAFFPSSEIAYDIFSLVCSPLDFNINTIYWSYSTFFEPYFARRNHNNYCSEHETIIIFNIDTEKRDRGRTKSICGAWLRANVNSLCKQLQTSLSLQLGKGLFLAFFTSTIRECDCCCVEETHTSEHAIQRFILT